jgi:hypothetical protein
MPRAMSSAMLAAITAPVVPIAIFAELTFGSGPVYLWSGMGPIIWNGQTWQGVGSLGRVSVVDEGSQVEARGIELELSGFDSTLVPLVMDEFVLMQPAYVYVGCFNAGALIDSPLVAFAGRMDASHIQIHGLTASLTISCESLFVDMNVAVNRRYTADDQNRDWPGDLGMNFVWPIQEKGLYWGTAPSGTNVMSSR